MSTALQTLLSILGITMTATRIDSRPDRSYSPRDKSDGAKAEREWDAHASHWRITFRKASVDGSFETYYSQGKFYTSPPTADDVLRSMFIDASAEDDGSFEAWADDLGYDLDSRSAERTYRACLASAAALRSLFGEDFDQARDASKEDA